MSTDIVDIETGFLANLAGDLEQVEKRYGKRAGVFFQHLPALFRLFHRLSFDLELTDTQRRRAASIAVYIAEPQDYLGEACLGAEGLVDDAWLAYSELATLLDQVPAELLQRHWRSEMEFEQIAALACNAEVLRDLVPSRVLEELERFRGAAS